MKIKFIKTLAVLFMLAALVIPVASYAVDPTPTPTPTPTVTPTPIPTPTPTPTPTPVLVSPYWSTVSASPVVLIADGAQTSTVMAVIKNSVSAALADKDVIISSSRGASDTITAIKSKTGADGIATFKISSSVIGTAVITAKVGDLAINQTAAIKFLPVGSQIGNPTTPDEHSGVILYRIPGDTKVYVIKNKTKRWIKTEKEFKDNGYDWSKIKDVTPEILATFTDAQLADALVKIVNAMNLRVRSADSATSAVLDTVKNSEVYQIVEKKNGWYKIKTKKGKEGWVSGKYAKEQKGQNED